MTVVLGIVLSFFALVMFVGVIAAFVWGAKKDGEEDLEVQRRTGIRRKTRIGL